MINEAKSAPKLTTKISSTKYIWGEVIDAFKKRAVKDANDE